VRTPSRTQSDIALLLVADSATPVMVSGEGKKGIDAENETAYQIGWRGAFSADLTVDATAFYAHYNDITRIERAGNDSFNDNLGFPAYVIGTRVGNNLNAQTYGAELSLSYQANDWWRNYLSYSFFKLEAQASVGHQLTAADGDEKTAPQHQMSLRNNFNVTSDIDFDLWWRYTDAITTNGRAINEYFNLDARLAWRPVKSMELSVIGQNLIQTHHIEHQEEPLTTPQTTYISRGVYAKVNWQF
jgi:iron complex outermembrane receptor protein